MTTMRHPADFALSIDTAATMTVAEDSAYAFSSHSRDSSGASDFPTPCTPTFSLPDQSRLNSSASSLASTPPCDRMDSPTLPNKTVLHDLAEDPSEREDAPGIQGRYRSSSLINDESDFHTVWRPRQDSLTSCDYDLSDGVRVEDGLKSSIWKNRRDSNDDYASPVTALKTRLSQRMPSLSRKLREKRSISSLNFSGVRSAPSSRAPSIRSPSSIRRIPSNVDVSDLTADSPPVPTVPEYHAYSSQPDLSESTLPTTIEEPIDRKSLASTPLLPPCMMERRTSEAGSVQSPLQSPTVAEPHPFSFAPSSAATPLASTVHSPILSSKPSIASFSASRASQARYSAELHASVEKLAQNPADEWADRLGHANFEIFPQPYAPIACDLEACNALTADWESARKRYLSHVARVSDDYGPTSTTYKLTEQKWAQIDARWKQNFDLTLDRARASGVDVEPIQCLTESTAVTKIPSIDGPNSQGKCMPLADNGEIVGPMVTYVSRIKPQGKKNAFLRFFSDLRLST